MMVMRKSYVGEVYVAFPRDTWGDIVIKPGLEKWLEENTQPHWAYIKEKKAGVYLTDQDAIAFRLKWM
jgi:hypothetical protein